MPVTFNIGEKEYSYPEGYQDCTLQKYMQSLDAYTKPKELEELEKQTTEEGVNKVFKELVTPNYSKVAAFYLDFVSFWTGLGKEQLGQIEGKTISFNGWGEEEKQRMQGWQWIESLYIQIRNNFARSLEEIKKTTSEEIEHKGRKYYLPTKHLKKATVLDFIEATQAEHIAKVVEKDQRKAIPKILCILLRSSKDAPYDPRQMQREQLFMSMSMANVYRVSFFLSKLNESYALNSLICSAILRLSQQGHKFAQA